MFVLLFCCFVQLLVAAHVGTELSSADEPAKIFYTLKLIHVGGCMYDIACSYWYALMYFEQSLLVVHPSHDVMCSDHLLPARLWWRHYEDIIGKGLVKPWLAN